MVPGLTVEWTSQARGVSKDKAGELLAIVMPNQSILEAIPKDVSRRAVRGEQFSNNVRGVVRVPRGGASMLCDYYAPPMSWLKPSKENEHE